MNTFFQHREIHKFKRYRPSMDQKSLMDFCIVLSDLFSDVLGVRVKRGAELSTDHHLVVCSLQLLKPWPNRKSNRSFVTYRIKWVALENKEVRKQFASTISSKFRQLPNVSEDIEKEWLLFRSSIISSAAKSCGRKRLRAAGDSEKKTPWWNHEVKEAIRANKDAFKAWLQDKSSSDLQSRYTEARKAATLAVKKSKEKSWEEFGRRLDSNYFSATKDFGKPSAVHVAKDLVSPTPSRILQVTLYWMRMKSFHDGENTLKIFFNPVKASTRDTH